MHNVVLFVVCVFCFKWVHVFFFVVWFLARADLSEHKNEHSAPQRSMRMLR